MAKQKNLTRLERVQLQITFGIRIILFAALVLAPFRGDWVVFFVSGLALFAMFLPSLLTRNHEIHLPLEFELILALYLYMSLFLGELQGFYTKFWWWDIVLHSGASVALGFVGFLILYALYRDGRLKTSAELLCMFSFAFAMALGALWEIAEYGVDFVVGYPIMQAGGLPDTVADLGADAAGALLAVTAGYFYIKHRRKGVGLFEYYIQSFFKKNHPAGNLFDRSSERSEV
jgi:hypothetical protein